jgi:hypothetical protein
MKNLVLSLLALFCISNSTFAQEIELGLNLGGGIPVGDVAEGTNGGFAWNINGYYGISEELSAGLEIGGTTFNIDIPTGFITIDADFTITEILAVGRYKFVQKDALDIGAGFGLGLYSGSANTNLGISPRVYGSYMITDEIGLTANIPFNIVLGDGPSNYLQIRVGGFYLLSL